MIVNVFVAFHERELSFSRCCSWLKGEPPGTRTLAAGSQKKHLFSKQRNSCQAEATIHKQKKIRNSKRLVLFWIIKLEYSSTKNNTKDQTTTNTNKQTILRIKKQHECTLSSNKQQQTTTNNNSKKNYWRIASTKPDDLVKKFVYWPWFRSLLVCWKTSSKSIQSLEVRVIHRKYMPQISSKRVWHDSIDHFRSGSIGSCHPKTAAER